MKISWVAILGVIAGGGLGVIAQALASFYGSGSKEAQLILNIAAIIAAVAGFVVQIMQPSAKIVQNAPVVDQSGQQVATNVSTTSTLPIKAQYQP